MFLYLNGLKTCIKHLYMFWNIWNLILLGETGKKLSICSDDYEYGAFIIGKPEQKFKIQSHLGIFYPLIWEGQWYDDTTSQDLKCICELFWNVWFLYSMKLLLDLCKILVDA